MDRRQILKFYARISQGDHRALLGVDAEADFDTIRSAYYEMCRQWHPDQFTHRDLDPSLRERIGAIFTAIVHAYRALRAENRGEDSPDLDTIPPQAAVGDAIEHRSGNELFLEGLRAFRCGQLAQARQWLERALTVEPNNPTYVNFAATVTQRLEKPGGNGESAEHHYQAGCRAMARKDPVAAANAFNLAAQLDPMNPAYRQAFLDARQHARRTLSVQWLAQARNAEKRRNRGDALRCYQKAVQYGVSEATVYARMGELFWKLQKDGRAALKYTRRAAQMQPQDPRIRRALIDLYEALNMPINAQREMSKSPT
ncbi:MAG: DnaJ domain-containing protein [Myxococcota bacterium]